MKTIRIGIVGSRRRAKFSDYIKLLEALTYIITKHKGHEWIFVSGGCPTGGDKFARDISIELKIPIVEYLPKIKPKCSKQEFTVAAFARNTLIAQDCDVLIALVAEDRKGGVEDTLRKAQKLNKPVVLL